MVSSSSNGKVVRDLHYLENDGPQRKQLFSISDHLLTIMFNINTIKPSIATTST
jgi:hypothetical protein